MTNAEFTYLSANIADKVAALWPTIKSGLKVYEDEEWFEGLTRMVETYREYV